MKLHQLQEQLKLKNIEAFLVTRNNMFLNQDVKDKENQLMALSGFTGSQGYMLVTPDKAWLFVDSRYSIQARLETDSDKIEVIDIKSFSGAITSILKENNINNLTVNPWCISVNDWDKYTKNGINLIEEENLVQNIFLGPKEIFEHNVKYSGLSSQEKAKQIAENLSDKYAAMLITSAEEVSWIANLRAVDLENTPVLRAFALLSKQGELTLFADNTNYEGILELKNLPVHLANYKNQTVLVERNFTPQKILNFFDKSTKIDTKGFNPISNFKLKKNQTEMAGFKNAHIRDGVAMVKFLHWFENRPKGLSEYDIVKKLKEFRQKQELFFSDSFSTIAASGKNAAIVHYSPKENKSALVEENTVFLLDSGAQYFDGTTDVTRTIAVGNVTDEIKNSFTQVLKAHISLSSLTFPINTEAKSLDTVCRSILWRYHKNYGHGTGHSVGHFSDVHESPFGLSPNNSKFAEENFITSIEPGYYKENEYGIRIENMVYITQDENKNFLKFKNLTLVPIDKRLINVHLLSSEELKWLNNYHKEVINCLVPYLDEEVRNWLKSFCSPL